MRGEERGGFGDGVGAARALGAGGAGDEGVDGNLGNVVEGLALRGIGDFGERFGADVFQETGEAGAALPVAGAGEPGEEFALQRRRPADGGVAQGVGVGDLLAIGAGVGRILHRAAVAVVAGKEGATGGFLGRGAGALGDGKKRDHFSDDRGRVEIDEERG